MKGPRLLSQVFVIPSFDPQDSSNCKRTSFIYQSMLAIKSTTLLCRHPYCNFYKWWCPLWKLFVAYFYSLVFKRMLELTGNSLLHYSFFWISNNSWLWYLLQTCMLLFFSASISFFFAFRAVICPHCHLIPLVKLTHVTLLVTSGCNLLHGNIRDIYKQNHVSVALKRAEGTTPALE